MKDGDLVVVLLEPLSLNTGCWLYGLSDWYETAGIDKKELYAKFAIPNVVAAADGGDYFLLSV